MTPHVASNVASGDVRTSASTLDEPVPMFDGKTPREAAAGPLRPRVVQALKDLENDFQRARAAGQPGFDPKELREELGIENG